MTTWPAGGRLVRSFNAAWGSRQFDPGAPDRRARFSPFVPARQRVAVPVLYAADGLDGAISETVFHDVPVRGTKRVARRRLRHRLAVALEPVRDLRLVDLTSPGLSRLGVARTELIETGPRSYPETAQWARALHGCSDAPDGLVWVSRQHDTSRAVVLFGDRVRVDDLRLAPDAMPLSLYVGTGYERVAQMADDAGITITEAR